MTAGPPEARRPCASLIAGLPFAVLLFFVWVILSEELDPFHLGTGAVTALVLARLTQRLVALSPALGRTAAHPMQGIVWLRFPLYVPWLAWQVVIASLQVAFVVLQPRLLVQPRVIRFRAGLPHTFARLTLANSITLTPGTVTLDVEDDDFVVHALTVGTAQGLESGGMQRRVLSLFAGGSRLEAAGTDGQETSSTASS